MKNNSWIEYPAYWLLRLFGALITASPLRINFILGRFLGICGFLALEKKRNLVIKNLKRAFPDRQYQELKRIAKDAFISLALNVVEALYIPRITSRYINKHIRIENSKYLDEALEKGKGVIFLAYHFGNWELANVTCGLQGYVYKVVVNEQRSTLINNLLNRYRESKGCKTIPRGIALRQIIKALKDNEIVAMVGDQGGREGKLVDFFGIPTPVPVGAVRFALSLGSSVIPVLIMRERRFYHRIILEEPLRIENTGNSQADLEKALACSNRILEYYVSRHPKEYFWFYKVWKYSPLRQAVILGDGKAGHLRQSQALLKTIHSPQSVVHSLIIEVRFKNRLAKAAFQLGFFFGIDLLKACLQGERYLALKMSSPDLVISAGASLASINLLITRENLARSVCIMKPAFVDPGKFDLVVMPRHDRPRPKKNVLITEGALNLIDEDYLKEEADKLKKRYLSSVSWESLIGLLVGGDTKRYTLTEGLIQQLSEGLKNICEDFGKDIMVTTSRRTRPKIETLIKASFKDYARCRLLVIANEYNLAEAVGGILGLAELVVVSGESISMISEAAACGKYVLVFRLKNQPRGAKTRHEAFLTNLERQRYVYIVEAGDIARKIKELWQNKPVIKRLDDKLKVQEAVRKLL